MTTDNPLIKLGSLGQSVWLDYIRRNLIESGELAAIIEKDGLRGMTSNPSIFEEAIAGSREYDDTIGLMLGAGKGIKEIYESISQKDVQDAADAFRPLYESTDGLDGYVSLEVDPHLAHDSQGTMVEARRLWVALDRPNVMIKVPATAEGLPVIKQLITEGINVNATLLFGVSRYRHVAEAYLAGLEARVRRESPITRVASVASVFVSRIDALIDPQLERSARTGSASASIKHLYGEVAIATSKAVYAAYEEIYATNRFAALAEQGARRQRLLWASTGTKNPKFSDVKYVEALIGPGTVNTMNFTTLDNYRSHGEPENRLATEADAASNILNQLPDLGINMARVAQQLEDEGVQKFANSFDKLLSAIKKVQRSY